MTSLVIRIPQKWVSHIFFPHLFLLFKYFVLEENRIIRESIFFLIDEDYKKLDYVIIFLLYTRVC